MESAAIYSSEVHEVDSGIPMILFKGFFESRCIDKTVTIYFSILPAKK